MRRSSGAGGGRWWRVETAWTGVDLVVCGKGHQGVAIRAEPEEMGLRVNLSPSDRRATRSPSSRVGSRRRRT
jgi:hypothetical protein